LEALWEAPYYLTVLRELLSKKSKNEKVTEVFVGEVYSIILPNRPPSKLQDLGSSSIPYSIGDL